MSQWHDTDGRRARGERKRAEIIAAALRVVERDGVAGVTHRTVAREAAVSPSATNYHFATLDDLLVAALTEAVRDYADQLEALVDSGCDAIDGLAALTADAGGSGRGRALAERELTLLAARRPALRPVARHWRETVAGVARRHTHDQVRIQAMVAAADGVCARVLLDDEKVTAAEVRAVLRSALGLD
ncbi:DNA-binding transcriptional regulator YbjK [Spinactinospora alkalitolerans]|uniref:DNA-binding transcriptional regulator YbjK n=1 Tax=Spinactinospora alkalitolerans TaxID=687207 RepID=A0A852TZ88_9ACTN|nr:TetR family transcriptional regulator [Spinactinospora alkalitolerans]NYE48342.1 DNA-binding transcriptional regulator YbjK [Spinactinospora alkalitolerans]